jgi:DNA sulfur modification protein DndB
MSLQEVATRVSFADEIHKSKQLSDMIQRKLKDERGADIAKYLQTEPERFFNSLVIAVYGGEPRWHGFSNIKPQHDDIDVADVPARAMNGIGFISLAGSENLFAVDGQHRLAGIKLAVAKRPSLGDEEVSVIFIAHARNEKGLRRTRKLFTTLNKTARPVGKGERIALDESDVMAIVVRHLVEAHPFFTSGIFFSPKDNLPSGDIENITTIGNLYEVLSTLFSDVVGKSSLEELRYYRPSDKELDWYKRFSDRYFKLVAKSFPPLRQYFSAPNRVSIIKKYRTSSGGHVLFRPVGLRILVEILAKLIQERDISLREA